MTPTARHENAVALMQQGRWQEARACLEAALAQASDDADALRLLGTLAHVTQRPDEARSLLERALTLAPDHATTLLNLGSVHLDAGRLDEAERCFSRLTEIDPDAPDGHFNLGLAAQRAGRLDDAERHYTRALARDSEAVDAAVNLAALHLHQGRLDTCLRETEQILAREPEHLQALLVRLQALVRRGRLADAERTLAGLDARLAAHPQIRAVQGELCFRTGRLTEAARAYRDALAGGDPRLETALNLGRCLLESGAARDAIDVLATASERHAASAECHAALGLALRDANEPERSLRAFERASELAPQAVDYVTVRAGLLTELGRETESEALLEQTIEHSPAVVSPHLLRVEQRIARGDPAGALDAADRFLSSQGPECNLLAAKGFLLAALGRDEEASALLDYDRLVQSWVVEPPQGYADLAAFNAALTRAILADPSLSAEGAASRATQQGRQSGNLLFGDEGPFADFERVLWRAAERYVGALDRDPEHPFLAKPPPLGAVYSWAVVLERSGFQSPHIHPTAWLSGVYYVALPGIMDADDTEQGWIEFGAPPPELALEPRAPVRRVRPEPGRIVLFPSYFYHRTVPYESDEQRISLAFDFSPRARR